MLFPTFSVKEAFVEKKTVPRMPFTESAYPDACDILLVIVWELSSRAIGFRISGFRFTQITKGKGQAM